MSSVLLRKLTLKSTMGFGKFKDLTVKRIIELKGRKGLNYLRWIYYNNSKISFTDDIIKQTLLIEDKDTITKPGVLKKNEYIIEKYYPIEDKLKTMREDGILTKGNAFRRNKISNSKSRLQRTNQGL